MRRFFFILVISILIHTASALTEINNDGFHVLNTDGEYYVLASDIHGAIFINSNNITLDGAGHTLMHDDYDGVTIVSSHVAIKNLKTSGTTWGSGFFLSGALNSSIINNTITGHDGMNNGITLWDSNSNNIISNNNITIDYAIGIDLNLNSQLNTISNNIVVSNYSGIIESGAGPNTFINNIITSNSNGVYLSNSQGSTFSGGSITSGIRDYFLSNVSVNLIGTNFTAARSYEIDKIGEVINMQHNGIWLNTTFANNGTLIRNVSSLSENNLNWKDDFNGTLDYDINEGIENSFYDISVNGEKLGGIGFSGIDITLNGESAIDIIRDRIMPNQVEVFEKPMIFQQNSKISHSKIYYLLVENSADSGHGEFVIMSSNLDGSNPLEILRTDTVQLTNGDFEVSGEKIFLAYYSGYEGSQEIVTLSVNLDGSDLKEINRFSSGQSKFDMKLKNNHIYYSYFDSIKISIGKLDLNTLKYEGIFQYATSDISWTQIDALDSDPKIYFIWSERNDNVPGNNLATASIDEDGSNFKYYKTENKTYEYDVYMQIFNSKIYYTISNYTNGIDQTLLASSNLDGSKYTNIFQTTTNIDKCYPGIGITNSRIFYVWEERFSHYGAVAASSDIDGSNFTEDYYFIDNNLTSVDKPKINIYSSKIFYIWSIKPKLMLGSISISEAANDKYSSYVYG